MVGFWPNQAEDIRDNRLYVRKAPEELFDKVIEECSNNW